MLARLSGVLRSYRGDYLSRRLTTGIDWVDTYFGLDNISGLLEYFSKRKMLKAHHEGLDVGNIVLPDNINLNFDLSVVLFDFAESLTKGCSYLKETGTEPEKYGSDYFYTFYAVASRHVKGVVYDRLSLVLYDSTKDKVFSLSYNVDGNDFGYVRIYLKGTRYSAYVPEHRSEIKHLKEALNCYCVSKQIIPVDSTK